MTYKYIQANKSNCRSIQIYLKTKWTVEASNYILKQNQRPNIDVLFCNSLKSIHENFFSKKKKKPDFVRMLFILKYFISVFNEKYFISWFNRFNLLSIIMDFNIKVVFDIYWKKHFFLYYLVYFYYYSTFFSTILKSHCMFWYYLWVSLYYFS